MKTLIHILIGTLCFISMQAQTLEELILQKEAEQAKYVQQQQNELDLYVRENDSALAAYIDQREREFQAYLKDEQRWLEITTADITPEEEIELFDEEVSHSNEVELAVVEPKSVHKIDTEEIDAPKKVLLRPKPSSTESLSSNLDLYVPNVLPVPKDKMRISSVFGMRMHPIHKKETFHSGIDLACPTGTEVTVTADGVILRAGRNGGYGKYVLVEHANGYRTAYAHLSKILVKEGDRVHRGDLIARVGSTGSSTGPHLHYEVILNGKKVNPRGFMKLESSPRL